MRICCSDATLWHVMDQTDRRIVALLRENARRSFKDIGDAVHRATDGISRTVTEVVLSTLFQR
jgi:DNA-binding Lrp family transcriptional regulator